MALRRRLGLRRGDRVEFRWEGDRTVLRPARGARNPFDRYAGTLGGFRSRRENNAWVRGLRQPSDGAGRRRRRD